MKILKMAALIAVILIVALIIAAPSIAEFMAFSRFRPLESADVKAKYKEWKTKRNILPAGALEAKPYSPELQAAVRAYHEAWAKHGGRVINKKELTGAPQEIAELAPLIDAFTALARRPDYKLGAITKGITNANETAPLFMAFQLGAKVLHLKAQAEAKAGRLDEALRDAETIVYASLSDGYDPLMCQLMQVAICSIGTKACNDVLLQCEDPAQLRRMLESQNALAGQFNFFNDSDLPVAIVDVVGMLREYKRGGVSVDYQDLTGRNLVLKYTTIQKKINASAQVKKLQEIKSGMPQQNVAQARQVQAGIDELKKTAAAPLDLTIEKESLMDRYKNSLVDPFLFGLAAPNFQESTTRANLGLTKFDLLRLETARKLYSLEKGKAPATDAELVPAFLPKLPQDRFAKEKTAAFKDAAGVRYSIGPDGKDNGNDFTYDPSNGTVSAGDIALQTR